MLTSARSKVRTYGVRSGARRALVVWVAVLLFTTASPLLADSLTVTPDETTVFRYSGVEGGPFDAVPVATWSVAASSNGVAFTAASSAAWLIVDPAAGFVDSNGIEAVTAELDETLAGLLPAGVHTADVTFVNSNSAAVVATRTVELAIAPASFSVTPPAVDVLAVANGGVVPQQPVVLAATGGVPLEYDFSWVERSWFEIDAPNGVVPAGGTAQVLITFHPERVLPGLYQANISIDNLTNGAGSTQLPIKLLVRAGGSGAVSLLPDEDITVAGAAGELKLPGAQVSVLTNGSDGSVLWQATVDAPWLSVSPQGGELAPGGALGGLDEQIVDVRVNAAANDLPAGSHVATATFQNLTHAVPIATRVARVVVDPLLSLPGSVAGGEVKVFPEPKARVGGADGPMRFDLGQVVTLTAVVEDGYAFSGWTLADGDDAEILEDNPAVVVMNQSRIVGALIAPLQHTLTLSTSGAGAGTVTASPTGDFVDNAFVSRHAHNRLVRLTASADPGYRFAGWLGNVPVELATSNPIDVRMDRERVITARFEPEVALTVAVVGEGRVDIDPDLEVYSLGATVRLIATPEEGYIFDRWQGDYAGDEDEILISLTDDTMIEAVFIVDDGNVNSNGERMRLTVEIDGQGVVSPSGGEFDTGAHVILIATPAVGERFVEWQGDASGSDLTVDVVMDAPHTVRAVFEPDDTSGRPIPGEACGAVGMSGLVMAALGCVAVGAMTSSGRRRRTSQHGPF